MVNFAELKVGSMRFDFRNIFSLDFDVCVRKMDANALSDRIF